MEQTKLCEFFSKRKRTEGLQPSKRRKVVTAEQSEVAPIAPIPFASPPGVKTRSRLSKKVTHPELPNLNAQASKSTRSTKGSKSKSRVTVKKENQKSIQDLFGQLNSTSDDKNQLKDLVESLPTAASDNHNASPPCTPTKPLRKSPSKNKDDTEVSKKRSRLEKTVVRDLFQEIDQCEGYSFKQPEKEMSERKVISPRRLSASKTEEKDNVFTFKGKEDQEQMEKLQQLAKKAFTPPTKEPQPTTSKTSKKKSVKEIDPEQLKKTVKAKVQKNPAALKTKLAQCGKLAELKEKLLELHKQQSPSRKKSLSEAVALSPSKSRLLDIIKNSPIKAAAKAAATPPAEPKKPAYERFASLVEPVPPGLTLPKHYKLLQDIFTSADTVVTMLHKRAEICTFAKLQKAVQHMTRKNFEEKTLGQIKTVYPSAYDFKQEKNLPNYGKKMSGYQLTVEANLVGDPCTKPSDAKTNDGRPDFTAAKILERKTYFHRKLIEITKKHHKEFLSDLEKPVSIPDNKVNKWHPRFPLDLVPEVEASNLPQPPDIKVITSAKAALDHAREKFHNPRVLKALETVAANSTEPIDENIRKGQTDKKPGNNSPMKTPKKEAAPIKGVSQSLLDRIRAKEAQKQEAAMFSTPGEDRRKERMGRLPELARILRTCFVTQKKPALPYNDVLENMTSSYKSSLGPVEAEEHLKLMGELVPEWMSTLTVKRGMFVKIDRNKDVNVIISKLEKLHKQA